MLPEMEGIKCVLLDIEGTVCPISFVRETLFPYALQALPHVLATNWDDKDFQPYRDDFPPEHSTSPAALQTHVEDLTRRDVKIAYLKNLQGYLWETGYETGAYSTPLFPDVARQLKHWKDSGLRLAIYSSGSVFAQKLLFGHVQLDVEGANPPTEDLISIIEGWYDTTNAGPKTESASYLKIAETLMLPAKAVLFFSDSVKEVKAAIEAGMKAVVVDRPGNAPLSAQDTEKFQVINGLNEISLSPAQIDTRFVK